MLVRRIAIVLSAMALAAIAGGFFALALHA